VHCDSDEFSGGFGDWARGVAGIRYSFELELRDRGRFGFLLPTNYIEPVGAEAWSAVRVLSTHIVTERMTTVPDVVPAPGGAALTDGAPAVQVFVSVFAVIVLSVLVEQLRLFVYVGFDDRTVHARDASAVMETRSRC